MEEYPKIKTVYKRDDSFKVDTSTFSCPEFKYLANNKWHFTEKVDGMNIRVKVEEDSGCRITGRTDRAIIPTPLVTTLQEIFFTKDLPKGMCFYGEGYGGKIQKGGCYSPNQSFVLFDVKIGSYWLPWEDVASLAETYDIPLVPALGYGTLYDMTTIVRNGLRSYWGDFLAEGIIAKPLVNLYSDKKRVVAKLKGRDF